MTEKPDNQTELNDEQFEAYLDGNSPVSHAYREADKPEPPPALDRAILNAAEAAAKSKRKNFLDWDMEFWRSWARPVSTVVIMGVSLAVVLQVMDIRPEKNIAMLDSPDAASPLIKAPRAEAPKQRALAESREEQKLAGPATVATLSAAKADPASRARLPNELSDTVHTAIPEGEAEAPGPLREQNFASDLSVVSDSEMAVNSITAHTMLADSQNTAETLAPADNAIAEWNAGAQASADIWLAGIKAIENSGQAGMVNNELTKMARYYPEIVARYRQEKGYSATAKLDSNQAAEADAGTGQSQATPQAVMADQSVDRLPNPDVWAAGIAWLHADDSEQAAAERAKLVRIYPDYVWQ